MEGIAQVTESRLERAAERFRASERAMSAIAEEISVLKQRLARLEGADMPRASRENSTARLELLAAAQFEPPEEAEGPEGEGEGGDE